MTTVAIRTAIFFSILVIMLVWESLRRKREVRQVRWKHTGTNLALGVVDVLVAKLLVPGGMLWVSIWAEESGWGMLNLISLPEWLEWGMAIVLLDLVIYWQHRFFHGIPVLWRLHRVHHSDLDLDVTSALRFHPLEILVSLLIKAGAIIVLGVPVMAVLLFEIILNGFAMFNHSNIAMPKGVDRVLRCLIVTPDMHRVHHSVISSEMNSNYGFNISLWDRIFASYVPQPQKGHADMSIGMPEHQDAPMGLWELIVFPFLKK